MIKVCAEMIKMCLEYQHLGTFAWEIISSLAIYYWQFNWYCTYKIAVWVSFSKIVSFVIFIINVFIGYVLAIIIHNLSTIFIILVLKWQVPCDEDNQIENPSFSHGSNITLFTMQNRMPKAPYNLNKQCDSYLKSFIKKSKCYRWYHI